MHGTLVYMYTYEIPQKCIKVCKDLPRIYAGIYKHRCHLLRGILSLRIKFHPVGNFYVDSNNFFPNVLMKTRHPGYKISL